MRDLIGFTILAFTSLLAIVNPISSVPMYLAMTIGYDSARRRATLRRGILTAFFLLVAFAALGTWIMQFFGITTHAFQIAGGIILFGIGWDMLQARRSPVKTTQEEEDEGAAKDEVGIIPLGIPTLAGPGGITTVIALNAQATDFLTHTAVYLAIVLVLAICWLVLAAAPAVIRRMGQTGMNVLTRLMGLIVMVVGAQFIINGVTVVLRGALGTPA